MGRITNSTGCPDCMDNGHDKTQNHLLHFEDGGKYCSRSHFHKSGKPYMEKGDGVDAVLALDIKGDIKYTVGQWKELEREGKLDKPDVRALALTGLTNRVLWEVANEQETEALEEEVAQDVGYFNGLGCRNLVDRHIRADIAAFYNVRVGLNEENKVARHYYPRYSKQMVLRGAKCRTLPKDFMYDHLGCRVEEALMFGQYTANKVMKEGGRKYKLLIVGGECDAMASQQMLFDAGQGQYAGKHHHVWSPNNGENGLEDILANKDAIDCYKEIIVGYDKDEVGQAMNRKIASLFRGKVKYIEYPDGCKDANDCLKKGFEKEFVDSWFNPKEGSQGGLIMSSKDLAEKAKKKVDMGLGWFDPRLNMITLGIRDNMMITFGAGSGVGKTKFTKAICTGLIEMHNEPVGVIYLEEPVEKTLRSFAGEAIGKRIELPAYNPDDPDDIYELERDFTEDEKNLAIDRLVESDMVFIANTNGDKSLDTVMKCIDDFVAMGIRKIVLDNLTAITLPSGNKVEALDVAMKALGSYKDENPITLFLVSHLKRVGGEGSTRKAHTHGGEVYEEDFRGSSTIVFWSNYVFGVERNTMADNDLEKRITTIRCVKDRDGIKTGATVKLYGDPEQGGRLVPYHGAGASSKKDFDTGDDSQGDY